MRKVKYRVWDKETESMYGSEYIDSINFAEGIVCCSSGGYNEIEWDCEIENAVFMQYTGITDRNGREIYEGDIVRNVSNEKIYQVVWNGSHSAFELKDRENQYKSMFFANQSFGRYEVIGNVFENPELLERE